LKFLTNAFGGGSSFGGARPFDGAGRSGAGGLVSAGGFSEGGKGISTGIPAGCINGAGGRNTRAGGDLVASVACLFGGSLLSAGGIFVGSIFLSNILIAPTFFIADAFATESFGVIGPATFIPAPTNPYPASGMKSPTAISEGAPLGWGPLGVPTVAAFRLGVEDLVAKLFCKSISRIVCTNGRCIVEFISIGGGAKGGGLSLEIGTPAPGGGAGGRLISETPRRLTPESTAKIMRRKFST